LRIGTAFPTNPFNGDGPVRHERDSYRGDIVEFVVGASSQWKGDIALIVCLNGKFVDGSEASVSVFDHGLLYGDGVFDTIAAMKGRIFWLEEHLDRLLEGCRLISLTIPWSRQQLIDLTEETFRRNGGDSGRIRITVTRGEGAIPILGSLSCKPNLIIFSTKLELYPESLYETGMKLIVIKHQRVYPQVKNLSFLPSVLGYLESLKFGANEALFVDQEGNVLEGSTFNIFVVRDGKLTTPPDQILFGITRNKVIELARGLGIVVGESKVSLQQALTADEIFATGTTKKILPVTEIDDAEINHGKVGQMTRHLMSAFAQKYF
jgi:branched-chain amino acid aminotransferase